MANDAGISVGMLSQLENGGTQGSVETLRKIAKVLGTTLAQLFADEDETIVSFQEPIHRVVRSNKRKGLSFADAKYKCELLTPDLQGSIEFVWVELEAGRKMDEALPHTAGGEECDLVIEGEIVVQIADEVYTLYKGDSIRFNPAIAHKIENHSNSKAIYVSAITPPSF